MLKTDTVGVFYFTPTTGVYSGTRFVCSAVRIDMMINTPHQATVRLAQGAYLANKSKLSDALSLYEAIQRVNQTEVTKHLQECAIYEQASERHPTTCVFRGYIVSASMNFNTESRSEVSVNLVCEGYSAMLRIAPGTQYFDASLFNLFQKKASKRYFSKQVIQATNSNATVGMARFLKTTARKYCNASVPQAIAACVNTVRVINQFKSNKTVYNSLGLDSITTKAIGGRTRFKAGDLMTGECCYEWLTSFMNALLNYSGTLESALLQILTSADYALQFCPRWDCDSQGDFKMDVLPVSAWAPRQVIPLNSSQVVGVDANNMPVDSLNTPEVLFVSFDELISASSGDNKERCNGVVGIAGANATVVSELRSQARVDSMSPITHITADNFMVRAKDYKAPKWLYSFVKQQYKRVNVPGSNPDPNAKLAKANTPKRVKDELSETDINRYPGTTLWSSASGSAKADLVAQALFNHMYMSNTYCSVQLQPSLRFGFGGPLLENCLGDTVILDLNDLVLSQSRTRGISLKGTIQTLTLDYSNRGTSHIGYSMQISRVRPTDSSEPVLECPIYSY